MWKVLRVVLLSVVGVIALIAALLFYFVYSPPAKAPPLTGTFTQGSIEAGGRKRTYLTYVPKGLPRAAPLVMVLHGSGETGAQMRMATGYGFERLADQHGFAVVYPDGFEGYWNGCNITGDYSANRLNIDDVGFLTALAGKLADEIGITHVFAAGVSRGGAMAVRLALEAPQNFRAVAVVSDSVPVPENFKCKLARTGTSSVMLVNGTNDPIVPFDGGEVNLFGVFLKRGNVLSAHASGQYLAGLNHIAGAPETNESQVAGGFGVERVLWRNSAPVEVELVAIHGGGHGMPQPYWRAPRLLGPTASGLNGPALIWDFFARQRPR